MSGNESGPIDSHTAARIARQLTEDTYSDGLVIAVRASNSAFAVPAVAGTTWPTVRPQGIILYRPNDYWMRMDVAADTMYGGFMKGGVVANFPLSPAVQTIYVVSVTGTDMLQRTWLKGGEYK